MKGYIRMIRERGAMKLLVVLFMDASEQDAGEAAGSKWLSRIEFPTRLSSGLDKSPCSQVTGAVMLKSKTLGILKSTW